MPRYPDEPRAYGTGIAAVALIVAVVVALGTVGVIATMSSGLSSTPISFPSPTAGSTQNSTQTSTETSAPQPNVRHVGGFIEFDDGSYIVGLEIPPGTYRAPADSTHCKWERAVTGPAGKSEVEGNITFQQGPQVATIDARNTLFTSANCGTWTSDLSQITKSKTSFGRGTFIVGIDVEPGRYTSPGGSSCYWARLSGFGDTLEDTLAASFAASPTAVTIDSGDVGFFSVDCGTWTRG